MKLSEFRDLIGAVSQWSKSVKSARPEERAREVEILKTAVAELRAAVQGKRIKTRDLERTTAVLLEADLLIGFEIFGQAAG